jgi:hypothetical protein
MLKLAQMAVAMNAFENSKTAGADLHKVTVASFFDELEKIAVDAKMFARIADKAAKRGWSGARETQSIRRIAKAEGRRMEKVFGPSHLPEHVLDPTKVSRPAAGGTVSGRGPKPSTPVGDKTGVLPTPHGQASAPQPQTTGQTQSQRPAAQTQQTQKPQGSKLMKGLAIGGGVVGAGMLGHAMPQQQQSNY